MQVYELARRSVLAQGKSVSQVSRELGLDWRTVRKMTREPVPPGYRLSIPRPRPKLGPYLERIEEIVKEDETAPSSVPLQFLGGWTTLPKTMHTHS